jgi:lipoprotein signal peptidase
MSILNRVFGLIVIISLNLGTSLAIQNFNLWQIKNYEQPLFYFGWLSFVSLLALGLFLVIKLSVPKNYPNLTLLILAGIVSNVIEKLYQGYVVDYIDLTIGVVNLADLQIYIGCIMVVVNELRIKQSYKT